MLPNADTYDANDLGLVLLTGLPITLIAFTNSKLPGKASRCRGPRRYPRRNPSRRCERDAPGYVKTGQGERAESKEESAHGGRQNRPRRGNESFSPR